MQMSLRVIRGSLAAAYRAGIEYGRMCATLLMVPSVDDDIIDDMVPPERTCRMETSASGTAWCSECGMGLYVVDSGTGLGTIRNGRLRHCPHCGARVVSE